MTGGAEEGSRSWWDHIQPGSSSSASPTQSFGGGGGGSSRDLEGQWNRTGAGVPGLPPDWSLYDDKKLSAALQIITHASAFLRLVSGPATTSAHRAVNFGAVCAAFTKCATLSLQLINAPSSAPGTTTSSGDQQVLERATSMINASLSALPQAEFKSQSEGLDWLRSPLPVQPALSRFPAGPTPTSAVLSSEAGNAGESGGVDSSYVITAGAEEGDGKQAIAAQLLLISENLICAVHNMVLQDATASPGSTASSSSGGSSVEVQKVLAVASLFAPHSFVRQVARWIKDLNL